MARKNTERRLAAILSAYVVGYRRRMEADEEATVQALRAYRELMDGLVADHRGRVFGSAGDSVIAEFASPLEAVRCAVDIQRDLEARNAGLPEDRRMRLRIGVNLGDVIVEGDNLLGDGVNIAARLEGLAEPGGICISNKVQAEVGNKLDLGYEFQGEQRVKNIAESVGVWRVLTAPEAAGQVYGEKISRAAPWRMAAIAAAVVLAVGAAAAVTWLKPWAPTIEPASIERMAFPLPDKPSIAVLPFANLSDDPGQDSFADGMTDDLITDLSRVSGLFVISRNSVFVYRNMSVNIRQVAEDLGVRYVLEGSVRRAGDQVRVNAQLIDATTGGHVWADRYDGDVADIFSVQDTFIRKIVKALAVNLTEEEQEEIALGQTSNIEAREVFQKGWDSYLRYSADDNALAIDQFLAAVELDPDYGRAYAGLGLAYLRGCQLRWNGPLDMSVAMANGMASRYLAKTKSRPSSLATVAASRINLYNNQYKVALTEATRAIAQDPNDPEGYIAMAWAMITTGEPAPGLELVERAMRLNPTYPNYYVLAQAMAHFTLGDLEKAAEVLATALERDRGATELAPALAATYARLGRREEAHAALRLWKPGASPGELRSSAYSYHFPYEWSENREVLDRIKDGVHIAALPLETTIPGLADALKSENKPGRIGAANMLGRFGPMAAEAVPALIDALADEEDAVRNQAVKALGKIGPAAEAAIPALTALLDTPLVGWQAKKALAKIAGK